MPGGQAHACRHPGPKKPGSHSAGVRREGACRFSQSARGAPPTPSTHRAGTVHPRSPPCRSSCRPAGRRPGCSAARTGTPRSSPARRPTAGRLRPQHHEGPAACLRPPLPGAGSPPRFAGLCPWDLAQSQQGPPQPLVSQGLREVQEPALGHPTSQLGKSWGASVVPSELSFYKAPYGAAGTKPLIATCLFSTSLLFLAPPRGVCGPHWGLGLPLTTSKFYKPRGALYPGSFRGRPACTPRPEPGLPTRTPWRGAVLWLTVH